MDKCFVTQYKGEVIDESLGVLGRADIKVTSNSLASMWLTSSVAQSINVLDPNENVINTVNLEANTRFLLQLGDISSYDYVTVIIPNAYAIQKIYCHNLASFGSDESAMFYIKLNNFSFGDIVNNEPAIQGVKYIDYSLSDDSSCIFLNIKTIAYNNDNSSNIGVYKGLNNIAYLGGMLSLENLYYSQSLTNEIHGEFLDVLAMQCQNGRKSGTLEFKLWAGVDIIKTTFDGKRTANTEFSVSFDTSGCVVTAGVNFSMFTGYESATYNRSKDEWTFVNAN